MLRLKDLREDRDLSGKYVADLLHVSQQQYSRLETGENRLTDDKLIILANFYKTSIDYILGLTNEIRHYPWINEYKLKK